MRSFIKQLKYLLVFILFVEASFAVKVGDRVRIRAGENSRLAIIEEIHSEQFLIRFVNDAFSQRIFIYKASELLETIAPPPLSKSSKKLKESQALINDRREDLKRKNQELERCSDLVRIPEVLEHFSHKKSCPENLLKTQEYLTFLTNQYIKHQLQMPINQVFGQKESCEICLNNIKKKQQSFSLPCGHAYHIACAERGIESYLAEGNLKFLTTCIHEGCGQEIPSVMLATLMKSPAQVVAVQRMMIQAVDSLRFCPGCGQGIGYLETDGLMNFGQQCQYCKNDFCFSCGKAPHHDVTCDDLADAHQVKKAFIHSLLMDGLEDQWPLSRVQNPYRKD